MKISIFTISKSFLIWNFFIVQLCNTYFNIKRRILNIDSIFTSLTDSNWILIAAWKSCHAVEITAQNERSEITLTLTMTYFYVFQLFDHAYWTKIKAKVSVIYSNFIYRSNWQNYGISHYITHCCDYLAGFTPWPELPHNPLLIHV